MLDPAHFPRLTTWQKTSDKSDSYNCIAWAADDTKRNWWPPIAGVFGARYWPPGVAHETSVEAFVAAFATVGYAPCDSGDLEPRVEKIAIYADLNGVQHAARQMADGSWTSKIGRNIDGTHGSVSDLEGGLYGDVVQYLSREDLAIRPRRTA